MERVAPVFWASPTPAVLAFSAQAYASCDGLEGKELKTCEKEAKKAAKAEKTDSRTVAGRREVRVP